MNTGTTLLLCLAICALGKGEDALPQISLSDLQSLNTASEVSRLLSDSGGKLGAFAVTGLDRSGKLDFSQSLELFRGSLGGCLGLREDLPQISLEGGSNVFRRTLASTDGFASSPTGCAGVEAVTVAFDEIEDAVANVIQTLVGRALKYKVPGDVKTTLLKSSPKKDHIHLYCRDSNATNEERVEGKSAGSKLMVPFHMDNGVFLLVTPTPDSPLTMWQSDGKPVSSAGLAKDSVIVLMGRGLAEWMLQDDFAERSLFWASPHAVPALEPGVMERAVYARMKVAPGDAVPTLHPSIKSRSSKTLSFDDVFFGRHDSPSALCDPSISSYSAAVRAQCEDEPGTAYCWMDCLPLPPSDECSAEAAVCENETGRPCGDNDMDATCHWTCPPTTTPPPTTQHSHGGWGGGDMDTTTKSSDVDYVYSDFCNGKADMLMGGFDVAGKKDNPCIVLFFDAWTLDEPWKFALGCVGVALIGLAAEALICFRRSRQQKVYSSKLAWMSMEAVCYASSILLGYLAMLVAMTYSVELFLCVCAGLVIGHVAFNLTAPVGETADPCCQATQNKLAEGDSKKRCSKASDSDSLPSYNSN